jgi:hypothetical protein
MQVLIRRQDAPTEVYCVAGRAYPPISTELSMSIYIVADQRYFCLDSNIRELRSKQDRRSNADLVPNLQIILSGALS